jgi:glutathione synthase/RimK-type ligase-like ATP-grasp enzyme
MLPSQFSPLFDDRARGHEKLECMTSSEYLIGFAGLGRILKSGIDISVLGPQLEGRIASDPTDANALMDVSTLLFLTMDESKRPFAFDRQQRALQLRQLFPFSPPANPHALRLIVAMAPGDMTSNTPVDCLLEDADVTLTLLYVVPGRPLPATLPEHDLIFVAIGESSANQVLLRQLGELPRITSKPIVNHPERISCLVRNRVSEVLRSVPGAVMPATVRIDRATLVKVQQEMLIVDEIVDEGRFPIIARPIDSQGGKNLAKLDSIQDLSSYLTRLPDDAFFVSRFVDYRSPDGQFKKYRVALIDGRPFACHLAISSHWMIHYFNANMDVSASKRNEEEHFFASFEDGFAVRHKESLRSIHDLIGLDYVAIDCAELPDGRLLIFEVDNAAIVHAFDDPAIYPYKVPAMRKAFDAFRAMLTARANRPKAPGPVALPIR